MSLSIVGVFCLNLDHDLRLHTEYLARRSSHFLWFRGVCVLHRSKQGRFGSIRSCAIHGFYVFCRRLCPFSRMGLPSFLSFSSSALTWNVVASFLYVAVMASVLAPLIFYYALRHMSASRFASLTYLQPVVTTVSSTYILSEKLTPNFVIGGCLVLSGVLLTRQSAYRFGSHKIAKRLCWKRF